MYCIVYGWLTQYNPSQAVERIPDLPGSSGDKMHYTRISINISTQTLYN